MIDDDSISSTYDPKNSYNETEFLRNKLKIAVTALYMVIAEGDDFSQKMAKSGVSNMGCLSKEVFKMYPEISDLYPIQTFLEPDIEQ